MVRDTSEDVITGHLVQALRVLNPRWWLAEFLNVALGTTRFGRQYYRRLRIDAWVNTPRYPRELLHYDEGSTQVDCVISWDNPQTTVFIEAKYGSDLSNNTANSGDQRRFPTDQLIRNIRVGLHQSGYFEQEQLFDSSPRDFVVILLSPEAGHPLVRTYRSQDQLRRAIPHSEKLVALPKLPFVGELGYADITGLLQANQRFFTRTERAIIDQLNTYLDYKKANRRRNPIWEMPGRVPSGLSG